MLAPPKTRRRPLTEHSQGPTGAPKPLGLDAGLPLTISARYALTRA